MSKMTDVEKEYIRNAFLADVGNTIKQNRTRKNISQNELAEFLGMDRTSISKYENGIQDINTSTLPLISIFCDFPMKEYITPVFDKELVAKFRKLVYVEAEKQHRIKVHSKTKPQKELTAKIYIVNGKEVIESVPKRKTESFFKQILSGKVVFGEKPFTDNEFLNYMQLDGNHSLCAVIEAGSGFLECLAGKDKKDTLKTMVSEFILRELIYNDLSDENIEAKRLYMFYKKNFDEYVQSFEN